MIIHTIWTRLGYTVDLFKTTEQFVIFFLDRLPQPSGQQGRHYGPRLQAHEQPVQGIWIYSNTVNKL